MPGCSFAFCDATRNLHKFPRDPDVRAKWTKFCYRQPDWVPGPGANICREHFTPESFSSQPPNSLKNCLKKDAVPTLRRGVKRQGREAFYDKLLWNYSFKKNTNITVQGPATLLSLYILNKWRAC